MRSNTFAARAGRWSAANRKKAIFGWLAFVIAAVAIGSAAGMQTPANDDSTVGDSGRGDTAPDFVAFVGCAPERLLAEDVLARLGGGDGRLGMQRVRTAVVK